MHLKGVHNLDEIDTPGGRLTLVVSIIVFVVVLLLGLSAMREKVYRDWGWFLIVLIYAVFVTFVVWAIYLWIVPLFERIQEWIETGT